jgi:hypothetical protein
MVFDTAFVFVETRVVLTLVRFVEVAVGVRRLDRLFARRA